MRRVPKISYKYILKYFFSIATGRHLEGVKRVERQVFAWYDCFHQHWIKSKDDIRCC